MEETLGIRNPMVGEKAGTKKKVRVVKKIVKKKVIRKVLKRVPVASNCNDLERVVSANADRDSHVETSKSNLDVDGLKEFENLKGTKVGDMEEGVSLERTSDSCRDESQTSGLVTSSMFGSQIHSDLQDRDQYEIQLMDSDQDQIELMGIDQNRNELEDSDQNRIKLQNGDQNRIELQDNKQNRAKLLDMEHDTNTTSIEEHEGEESVKELIVNSETDGLQSQESLSESKVASEKMVASRLHMKQMTKIFIHGLGQETKEEDIRKVFEEVGEVTEVKKITNFKTGKNRGFGFIRFASADLANLALAKYQNVEICGRLCHTAAIEGIDTILLHNIDKKWNNENVVELLQKIGIKKIDEVLVVPDPDHSELNCGLAFLEFETKKDAQMAYQQLQNETISGKHSNIKVSWASPSVNPVKEEIHSNKSVYAEHIPLSWDEKEVNDHFKMFGEIESIALAKNLRTTKRNDFAFINYKTCEGALSCIEALTCKKSTGNNDPKGNLKVSLAKSIPKVKPISHHEKAKRLKKSQNQYQTVYQSRQSQQNMSLLSFHKLPQKLNNMIGKHEDSRKDFGSSTTSELVQILREQASWKQDGPSSAAGMSTVHHQPPPGAKQPAASHYIIMITGHTILIFKFLMLHTPALGLGQFVMGLLGGGKRPAGWRENIQIRREWRVIQEFRRVGQNCRDGSLLDLIKELAAIPMELTVFPAVNSNTSDDQIVHDNGVVD
ncbi:hypothetical protein E3N88_32952 [Mikania micrantha]|uniref:RRM domain-containing protein n=1 Tax=Mikania micrantha TaxID=192012 RepID=A0A5N6MAF5_9ASTR|nr:hypothetical protein E3N88_32952 [Mikania micrantha]